MTSGVTRILGVHESDDLIKSLYDGEIVGGDRFESTQTETVVGFDGNVVTCPVQFPEVCAEVASSFGCLCFVIEMRECHDVMESGEGIEVGRQYILVSPEVLHLSFVLLKPWWYHD